MERFNRIMEQRKESLERANQPSEGVGVFNDDAYLAMINQSEDAQESQEETRSRPL